MGKPEIVVKRAWPCSSRFTPLGAPIGRSGDFSSVGASVFSAHCCSSSAGWRFSNTSTRGLSATGGRSVDLLTEEDGFFSMQTPRLSLDHREGRAPEQGDWTALADRSVGA